MEIKPKRDKCIWSNEELAYLEEKAGVMSITSIAKKLGRTVGAVRTKCDKEEIPIVRDAVLLQLSDVARLVGVDNKLVWYWINLHGLPHKRITLNYTERPFIEFENLVVWLEKNQDKWNTDRMEMFALGEEFDWLKKKRKKDIARKDKKRQKPWTDAECRKVYEYLAMGKGWIEIAEILQRPPHAKTIQAALYRYQKKMRQKKIPVDTVCQ